MTSFVNDAIKYGFDKPDEEVIMDDMGDNLDDLDSVGILLLYHTEVEVVVDTDDINVHGYVPEDENLGDA